MIPSHLSEEELFGHAPGQLRFIEWAIVGWHNDPDVLVSLGKDEEDGVTCVKVTLFAGAPAGKRLQDDGTANGMQAIVQPMGPGWHIPDKGARVVVAFPHGDVLTPGNGLILGVAGISPAQRFGRKKVILDFGDRDVVITGKSVTLLCDGNPEGESDKQKRHLVSVSPDGGAQIVSGGCGLFVLGKDSKGNEVGEAQLKAVDGAGNLCSALVLAQDSAGLSCVPNPATPAAMNLKDGNVTITGAKAALQTGSVALGATATTATPVQVGPVAANGVPSTAVFAAP